MDGLRPPTSKIGVNPPLPPPFLLLQTLQTPYLTSIQLISKLGNYLAFDIASEFIFGQNFHLLTSPENRFIIDAVLELNKRSGAYAQSPTLARFHFDLLWPPTALRLLRKSLQWRGFVRERLQSQDENPKGLFYKLLGVKDPETGEPISYNELMAEAQLLQVAGT